MGSLIAALSVGSMVQNIEFYLFCSFLFYFNCYLLKANHAKKANAPIDPERNVPGHALTSIVPVKQRVAIGIHQKIRIEQALEEKTAELENVLEHMTDAYYTVDSNWNFTYVNKAYETLQQRDRAGLLGKNVW